MLSSKNSERDPQWILMVWTETSRVNFRFMKNTQLYALWEQADYRQQ